jgi:hypothetical protein
VVWRGEVVDRGVDADRQARDAPVDGGGAAEYEAAAGPGGVRSRSEALLVQALFEHMVARGRTVVGRHYVIEGEARVIRADLFVKDFDCLVEAKATDARHAIRMAVGQLYDYRRFETTVCRLAVLVPRRPVPDLLRFLSGLDIACIWPHAGGFRDTVGGALVT